MATIDFRQVAGANFNDSNALRLAAAQSGNTALTGLQGVFQEAMGAVQNRNHADMQAIINQQTPENINDPTAVAALMEQFKGMAAATGNNWDPTVIGAALDTRKDTLLNRGGKQIGNAQAGVDLQSATQDMTQTGIVNARTNSEAEAASAAAKKEAQYSDILKIMSSGEAYLGTLDMTTPEGKAEAAKYQLEMDQAIAKSDPDGIDMLDSANLFALGESQNNDAYERRLRQKTAETNINNAIDANTRGNVGLSFKIQEGTAKTQQAQVAEVRNKAELYGLPPTMFKKDGSIDAGAAAQGLAAQVDDAVRKLRNPTDSVPFADRVLEYMKTPDDNRVLDNVQLGQAQKSLTNYALQNVQGKSLKLNDDEKWAVIQAMATGELQSDSAGTWNVAGVSNYEGLYEEVVPNFVNRLRQQTQPIKENNAIAEVYANFFGGAGKLVDAVELTKIMNMGPDSEHNKYLPPSLRNSEYKGPVYTDKPEYVDKALKAKRAAAAIEKSGNQVKPSKASGGTPRSVYDLRNNY